MPVQEAIDKLNAEQPKTVCPFNSGSSSTQHTPTSDTKLEEGSLSPTMLFKLQQEKESDTEEGHRNTKKTVRDAEIILIEGPKSTTNQITEIEKGLERQVDILRVAAQNQCDEIREGTEKRIAILKDAADRQYDEIEKVTVKKVAMLKDAEGNQLKALDDMTKYAERLTVNAV
ncbi:hypothetical protein AOQ84DRAFT_229354 [Glonium stellatum]|uniref:Uncharacterized protein n=1 Tax=Glonium stellatum TaxID=574774 RepID=A0A8E2F785_9PEZI|nr:hypothetical protein AOQ84DRAFT_229354 [Glonium stellatum]